MSLSQSFSQKIGNVRPLNPCPSLDIDFANGGYVTDLGFADQASVGSANFNIGAFNGPDPIFTRATAATFRGSNGLIQYAPENLLQRSEEFNDASWTKTGLLAFGSGSIANAITSPDGTVTSDFICENVSSSAHAVFQKYDKSYQAFSLFTWSVYVSKSIQANSRSHAYVMLVLGANAAGTANKYVVNVNLTNGSVSDSKVGSNISNNSCTVQEAGSFWRVSLTASCSTSGIENYLVVGCSNSGTPTYDANNDVTYQGNGTSGIYIWGAQLERSSTARPYISTTTTPRYGPRFEYDLNGNPLGLLMEEQSQNLLSYSEQFDNAAWARTGIKAFGSGSTANAATSPNGTTTADLIVEDTSTGNHFLNFSCVMGALPHTISCYMKSATATTGSIFITQSGNVGAVFDLSTGQVVSVTGTGNTASISNAGNGWYLCSVTNNGSSDIFDNVRIGPRTGAISSYLGDGTSGIYIWGAQLEQKPFATSYIPTVGGPITRNADVVSSTIGSWFNQPEGTIVVSGDRNHNPALNTSSFDSFFEFSDDVGGFHSAHLSNGTSEQFYTDLGSGLVTTASIQTIGSLTGIACSYSLDALSIGITRDGITPNNAPIPGLTTVPVTLNIGYSAALGDVWNGHIKTFRYYPKALPSKLQQYSNP